MSELPIRRQTAALAQQVEMAHAAGVIAAAELQAIEYATNEGLRSAVGIALQETLATQIAPHASERFRVIAEAGTQALIVKTMQLGR